MRHAQDGLRRAGVRRRRRRASWPRLIASFVVDLAVEVVHGVLVAKAKQSKARRSKGRSSIGMRGLSGYYCWLRLCKRELHRRGQFHSQGHPYELGRILMAFLKEGLFSQY